MKIDQKQINLYLININPENSTLTSEYFQIRKQEVKM